MQIGQAARAAGVSTKMVRHYEAIGLLPVAHRSRGNYRDYAPADVHRLQFIRSARNLGFPIERIRSLLALWSDQQRSNAEVKRLALEQVAELESKAQQLQAMSVTLRRLAHACEGDGRPDCPILEGLEAGAQEASALKG